MEFQRQPLQSVVTTLLTSVSGSLSHLSSDLGGAASGVERVAERVEAAIGRKHYTVRQWRKQDPIRRYNQQLDLFEDKYDPGTGGHRTTDILSDAPRTSTEGHLRELRNARGAESTLDGMLDSLIGSDLTIDFNVAASGQLFEHHDTQVANKQLDMRDPIVGPAYNQIGNNATQSTDLATAQWITLNFPLPPRAMAARMVIYESGSPASLVGVAKVQFFSGSERVYPATVTATSNYDANRSANQMLTDTVTIGDITTNSWFSAVAPSSANPQVLLFTLADLTEITHLRFLHTDSSPNRQPKKFEFQFATTAEVSLYDAVDAENWVTMDVNNGLPYPYVPSASGAKAGLVNLVPQMMSNVTPAGTADASSIYSAGYEAWHAFNNTTGDYWHASMAGGPWWVSYDFGIETPITRYALTGYGPSVGYNPKTWTLEGTSDGITWTVLDTKTDYVLGSTRHEFVIAGAARHRRYRLHATANCGAGAIVVTELELIDFAASPNALDYLAGTLPYAGAFVHKLVDAPNVSKPPLQRKPLVSFKFWWQDATFSDNAFNSTLRLFLRVNDGTPVEWTSLRANGEFAMAWISVEVPWSDVKLGERNKVTFYAEEPSSGYKESLYFLDTRLDIPTSDSTYLVEYAMSVEGYNGLPRLASDSVIAPMRLGQNLKRASGLILADNLNRLGNYDLSPLWDGLFTNVMANANSHLMLSEVQPGRYQKEGSFETDPFTIPSALRRSFSSYMVATSGAGVELWYRGGSSARATLNSPWRRAERFLGLFPTTDQAWIQIRLIFRGQGSVIKTNARSVSGSSALLTGEFDGLELKVDDGKLKVLEYGLIPNHDLFAAQLPKNLGGWNVTLNTGVTGTASGWAPASGGPRQNLVIRQGDASASGTSFLKTNSFLYEDAAMVYVKGTSFSKMSPGRGEIRIRKASDGSLLGTCSIPDLNPKLKTPSPGASGAAAGLPVIVAVPSLYGETVYFEITAATSST